MGAEGVPMSRQVDTDWIESSVTKQVNPAVCVPNGLGRSTPTVDEYNRFTIN
ncbi:hypothetical protein D3C87_2122380 [compost metagenome]